ncbi:hypothetical protein BU17DRAFT_99629 [Hysterangium stoloniferum]|nr:hypothetical protein BU17DRAFT_99629 [Hysterangium stoloniferum]
MERTPRAWLTIILDNYHPRNTCIIESWFEKSKSLPINVYISPTKWKFDCATAISTILQRHRARFRLFCNSDRVFEILNDHHISSHSPHISVDELAVMPELTIIVSIVDIVDDSHFIDAPRLQIMLSSCTSILARLTVPTVNSLVRLHISLETTEVAQEALRSLHLAPSLQSLHIASMEDRIEWASDTIIILPALKSLHFVAYTPLLMGSFYEALECPRLGTLTFVPSSQDTPWLYAREDPLQIVFRSYTYLTDADTFIFRNRSIANLTVLEISHAIFYSAFFEGLLDHQLSSRTLEKILLTSSYPSSYSATKSFSIYVRSIITAVDGDSPPGKVLQKVSVKCLKRRLDVGSIRLFKRLRRDFPAIVELDLQHADQFFEA